MFHGNLNLTRLAHEPGVQNEGGRYQTDGKTTHGFLETLYTIDEIFSFYTA